MFDARIRPLIDPALNAQGRVIARWGISANQVTLLGLALGLLSAALIALGMFGWALLPLLLSRLADGLDGAVARASAPTGFGGYLDITCDFLFYGAVTVAFVLADPGANGWLLYHSYAADATRGFKLVTAPYISQHTENLHWR